MHIVIAIDSFKGSLTSLQAGKAVETAALRIYPEAETCVIPIADGGEGTVDAMAANGRLVEAVVSGPLGTPVKAQYCILRDSQTAVIEMAAAAGLPLVPEDRRNPLETTTYGVGELILHAMEQGCRRFLIGIGGSATNDGGTGMLTALGYGFLDQNGDPISLGAKGLKDLYRIDTRNANPLLQTCSFQIACDVTNPLCGKNGCSVVYGPQKGATESMIAEMDWWLEGYARAAGVVSAKADPNYPGAGAAGGMGFAFLTFTNATLRPGIQIIMEEMGLEEKLRDADLVITGEGRLDGQTVMGKAPIGVAKLAKKHGKKVIAFSGCVTPEAEICNEHGIDAFFPILRSVTTLEEALKPENAYANLTATACQVFRLLK